MNLTTLRCAVNGKVATIALARPDKLNALNATMHAELRETLQTLERDEAVRLLARRDWRVTPARSATGPSTTRSCGQACTRSAKRLHSRSF